jgi:hypothetical protein
VAQVNIIGGQEREVSLDAIKMQGMAFDSTSATGNFII